MTKHVLVLGMASFVHPELKAQLRSSAAGLRSFPFSLCKGLDLFVGIHAIVVASRTVHSELV